MKTVGNADTVSFDGVRIRSSTVRGSSAGDRSIMFRLGWELNLNGSRLKFNNLALQGLPSNAQYLAYGSIVGLSRTSNVATAYTLLPHRLRNGDAFRSTGQAIQVTTNPDWLYRSWMITRLLITRPAQILRSRSRRRPDWFSRQPRQHSVQKLECRDPDNIVGPRIYCRPTACDRQPGRQWIHRDGFRGSLSPFIDNVYLLLSWQ